MNIPLFAVLKPSGTIMFEGLHRVVGFIGQSSVLLIRISPPNIAPFETDYELLQTELDLARIELSAEPQVKGKPLRVEDIKGASKNKYEKALEIIRDIVPSIEHDQAWLAPDQLEDHVALSAQRLKITRIKVARTLYRWLVSSRSDLGLAPRNKSGPRTHKLQSKGNKRGRKYRDGAYAPTIKTYSLATTPDVREKLEKGVLEFYDPSKRNFTQAYNLTIAKYFTKTVKGRKVRDAKLPSPRQFRTAINRLNNKQDLRKANVGEREFGREHRGLAGKEGVDLAGPTIGYQTDTTFPAIDLVSELDRSIVLGKATVYLTVDAHTGYIAGDYETYQTASLDTARTALFYAFSSKREVWKRHGVPMEDDDFDCAYVCHQLSTDRGELRSIEGDNFVRGLGIRLITLQGERPDLKGTVEKCNDLIEAEAYKMAPGFRTKGKRNENVRPALTLSEFRTVTKRAVMKLNLRPAKFIPMDAKVPKDGKYTRMDHQEWGIKNTRGAGVTWPPRELYLKLLPQEPCTFNRAGVSFRGLTYSSNELANSGLTAVGDSNTTKPGIVCFDRDDVSRIWFKHPLAHELIEVNCLDKRVIDDRACLEDALMLLSRDRNIATATTVATQHRRSSLAEQNHQLYSDAKDKAKRAQRGVSKAAMKRHIKTHRPNQEAVERAENIADKQRDAGIPPPQPAVDAAMARNDFQSAMDAKRRKLASLISKKF